MNTKETIYAILAETGKAVLGKDDVLRRIRTAILAGGHILIDDIPGVGKTTMAVAFTRTLRRLPFRISISFSRDG